MKDPAAKPYRVAYLVTHPIQYQAPLLRMIAADPSIYIKTFFASGFSAGKFHDREMGQTVEWDVPLLDGYDSEVLPAYPGTRYPGDSYFDAWRPFSRGLRRRLVEGRFDALWIHGYARLPHLLAIAAARSAGVRVLLRDETNALGQDRSSSRLRLKRTLFRLLDPMIDAYLTIGRLNAEHFEALGVPARKFFPVAYAVDNQWFQARIAEATIHRETLRSEFGIAPGRPVALYAAKLIDRKAPLDLIESFADATGEASSDGPVLLMAGDGELRPAIEAAVVRRGATERIRLLGFQNQRALAGLYDLCDLFVLPSARETWGLVVNEAMNAGKPVIASDRVGSAYDLVREGVNGFVYPLGDVPALTRCLREALADPAGLARMGRESLRAIDLWDFRQNIAGLKSALAAVVPGRAGRP